ncbi:hypothetical protein [Qipengyuania aquimaris]|nr:hypothetical protein [Qipengyuania aquimaris]MCA0902536.1 hypothetical protein [Qipengyuania aquimaris]
MTTRFFLMESFLPIEAVYDEQSPIPELSGSGREISRSAVQGSPGNGYP